MADTISQHYDTVYNALNFLAEASIPGQIGPTIKIASGMMSALRQTGQELAQDKKAWKLMKVMVRMALPFFPRFSTNVVEDCTPRCLQVAHVS